MTEDGGWQPDRKRIFLLLALYFTLHLILRLYVSDSAELDEAEQLLLTQDLRLGYGSQPPVYSWILGGLFSLLGTNILALALLKNTLLFSTYSFVYLSAKEITGDATRAVIAMLSLFLIPQIFWESQRDLTHSVLGTSVAACTLYLFIRLLKSQSVKHYVWFGLCAGLGIMSKYNYAVFLVALYVAGCSVPRFRPALLNRKMFLSLFCLLLVVSPHLHWALTNMETTLSTAGKFKVGKSLGLFESYALGVKKLVVAVLSFLGLLIPVYALFFYRRRGKEPSFLEQEYGASPASSGQGSDYLRLMPRTLAAGLLLCVLMILCFKVTVFKDRWMQPLLFATPLYLVALPWGRFTPVNARRYAGFATFIALAVLLLMPGQTVWATYRSKVGRLNSPYSELAAKLRQAGFQGGHIVAQGRLVGGNLKLFFPESVVVAPEVPLFDAPAQADRLIVWDATKEPQIPESLAKFAAELAPAPPGTLPAQYIEAPYKYLDDRSMRLGYLLLRKEAPQVAARP